MSGDLRQSSPMLADGMAGWGSRILCNEWLLAKTPHSSHLTARVNSDRHELAGQGS